MATLRRELAFDADASTVWAGVSAVATPHVDLVPGFVTDARLDGDVRTVTFVTGSVARELVVDIDHEARRLAYAVVDSPMGLTHHHATMRVDERRPGGSRLVWTVDALPDTAARRLAEMMAMAAETMVRHFSAAETA
jgi:hypothetical protein